MFSSAALSQLKLSKIDSNHFRVPFYSDQPLKPLSTSELLSSSRIASVCVRHGVYFCLLSISFVVSNLPLNTLVAEPKLIYQTEPVAYLNTSQIVPAFD